MAAESELTEMDRVTGDGDLGRQHGACGQGGSGRSRVLSFGQYSRYAQSARSYPSACVRRIIGTALWGVVSALRQCSRGQPHNWIGAMGRSACDQGCRAISELGGAKPGDRTMLDALDPFVRTLQQGVGFKADT